MSSERDEHDGRESPGAASPTTRRPLWRRAGVWIGGVIAAGLATVAATTFTQVVDWFTVSLGTSGAPVVVRVDVEERLEDVVLPTSSTLTEAERGRLADMSAEQQVAWLVENEDGMVTGSRSVVLTLRGNRGDPIRITDLRSIEACESIDRGMLIRMMTGRGAGVDSTRVNLDVGWGTADAYVVDQGGERESYFPDRTITLSRDEEMVVIVDLHPGAAGSSCTVELELTVWDGDVERLQRISDEHGPFRVVDWERDTAEAKYDVVYLGGELCRNYVVALPNWVMTDPDTACGPGNVSGY